MRKVIMACLSLISGGGSSVWAQTSSDPSTRWNELTTLPFEGGYPSTDAGNKLRSELQFQHAVQTYLWALPAMSLYAMRQAQEKQFGTGANVMAIWKDRLDAKTVVLTGNPDAIYAFAWLDLKRDGPTVVEAPSKIQGLMDDMWHRPLADIGFAGPDKGRGGKYLVLPPDYKGKMPSGYYVLKSPTYGVYVFWRGFLENGKTGPGVGLIEKTRIYPLAQKDNPPAMKFPNASRVPMNMLFPTDATYFDNLAKFLDAESVAPEHFAMRGMAADIGIIKGKPFSPDAQARATLDQAARVAYRMAGAVSYDFQSEPLIWPDRAYRSSLGGGSPIFHADTYADLLGYVGYFHKAYGTSAGMFVSMPGKGAQYIGVQQDPSGGWLMGNNTYHIHVPANVPVENYWSFVIYDAETRSLLDNGQLFPSVASNDNLKLNPDGSADLYFGPERPNGALNWIRTVSGRGWFGGFRFYSPTQAYFDKKWKPGDIEKVN